jgi:parallel beta-helix repeat protein
MLLVTVVSWLCAADVVVHRDNTAVTESGTIRIGPDVLADEDDNGVIQVTADGIVVDFDGAALRGSPTDKTPDQFVGVGIRVTGKNVTLRNAKVSGYKCAILAVEADGLTLEGCDVSGNFRQRLRSTPRAEDGADWLWPHRNDEQEWRRNYGAGICIERSRNVTIRDCRARHGQNGILLDRVTDSKVYDNDFSFLSGWGLAMWRSSRNVVSRNAFDFCVRGYSHGVYNRGQDSAGILMFEQCCENVIAENSATHGGDGFFGFAGREALGETWLEQERERLRTHLGPDGIRAARERLVAERGEQWAGKSDEEIIGAAIAVPADVLERRRRAGNNDNLLINNDFSYAAAHGIEMTFSFANRFVSNRLIENAICGIWAGYSQSTLIWGNWLERNGQMGYGLERGGVNIEHGRGNTIEENIFKQNRCGVHVWGSAGGGSPLAAPWARANDAASEDNVVVRNRFEGEPVAIQLRDTRATRIDRNRMAGAGTPLEAAGSDVIAEAPEPARAPGFEAPGKARAIDGRPELRGRDKIIMTEWGPYDWDSPYLQFVGAEWSPDDRQTFHVYRLLGRERVKGTDVGNLKCNLESGPRPDGTFGVRIAPAERDVVWPYDFTVTTDSGELKASGVLVDCTWRVRVFAWKTDPRDDLDAWHAEAEPAVEFSSTHELSLKYGMGGPSDLPNVDEKIRAATLPRERFGTIAETTLTIPLGTWRLTALSDDGVRVWVDGQRVIDNWTWHGPTEDSALIERDTSAPASIRVEHFELDGYAVLSLSFAPADKGAAP